MNDILLWHAKTHPSMTAQDAIKLCHQATFGAEHLLTDADRAHAYFDREWDTIPSQTRPIAEMLSEKYGRVDLAAWKTAGLPREWLFRMFYHTASSPCGKTERDLNHAFSFVEQLAQANKLPFSATEWQTAIHTYWTAGGGAVHHSESYRTAEHPAYRVVDRQYIRLIPLLQQIASLTPQTGNPIVIAIDGRAASGKSTLAKVLSEILEAGLIHMDDFFLPPAVRTTDRLAEPGGNVHYERFSEQVLPYLKHNESFIYPAFDCQTMRLSTDRIVKTSSIKIVEGSYSHHPKFGKYMDLRIFCNVTKEKQMQRILARNGEQIAQRFASQWIPMEEQYFDTCSIRASAQYIFTTEQETTHEAYL